MVYPQHGLLLAIQREEILIHTTNKTNLKGKMLNEKGNLKGVYTV